MMNLKHNLLKNWEAILAGILILVGVVILARIYGPLLNNEVKYQFSTKGKNVAVLGKVEQAEKIVAENAGMQVIQPIDEIFGIVIPKISANAKVVADVDPNDSSVYQEVLTRGVAQAHGSANPGEKGNVFIFAHSGVDFSQAAQYNAVFYLLGNLKTGDDIFLFHNGEKFHYAVKESKIVAPEDVKYLENGGTDEKITLMTCWPAGTTLQRLIIIGERVN